MAFSKEFMEFVRKKNMLDPSEKMKEAQENREKSLSMLEDTLVFLHGKLDEAKTMNESLSLHIQISRTQEEIAKQKDTKHHV